MVSRRVLTQSQMSKQGLAFNHRLSVMLPLYHSCYIMKADGVINFIDHNFLWVSPIMALASRAHLRNSFLPSLLVHINKMISENSSPFLLCGLVGVLLFPAFENDSSCSLCF